ncbi:guanine nucleotide-binding protein subunit alpha, other [Cladophialophora psammophila CBS 110553]|uniref:Guanine nucleotide-binding protein subunit alpha, other n=1 Tax=Cladophialophora psammophila CBS 110553 TaxID=1182543 RepID=W9WQL6_9EURO|nr:guanine nucleotide-binding protein subunit alpha, other [Cladophialophora psammophila CBS 110553]EXJ67285.1 guanine nucleotide-binding protein subunit alpha, other [Cladophialophora psammophila CBS 110553]
MLLLNSVDKFKSKLGQSPLGAYFSDYIDGNDVNRAAKYIFWRFNQLNRANLNLSPHLTMTTDETNIRLVFAAFQEIVLQSALRNSEIF